MKRIWAFGFFCLFGLGCETVDKHSAGHASLEEKVKSAGEYVSTNAREYTLSATTRAPFPNEYEALSAEAQTLALQNAMDRKMTTAIRALKRHVKEVLAPLNGTETGEKAAYFTYFRRNDGRSADYVAPASETHFIFDFEVEFVGSYYLMSKLSPDTSGRVRTFSVDLDTGDTTETLEFVIEGQQNHDAFPRYGELFEDDVLDIAIHFGGDYNEERLDIETAKWLVELLLEDDWQNEAVSNFESLTIDSPPFTRTLQIEDRMLTVEVYIYHSDMVEGPTQSLLIERMEESLAQRDIVFYSGHAGENAGFILDYQPRYEIPARDFASLPLAQKYQIYLLDGCRTYRTYVHDLMKNDRKTFETVDIVTTVNTTPFSAGYRLIYEFLYWLTLTNDEGVHFPVTWKDLLRGVNTRTLRSVHYGVHGVASNPKLNPHGSEGISCRPCLHDSDCGAGGNLCLNYALGNACGVACTTDSACGSGYRCARITEDPDLFYIPKQCVRRNYLCNDQ